jgi:autotransporter-associated beta strand protein
MFTLRCLSITRQQPLALFLGLTLAFHTVSAQTRTWSGAGDSDNWSTANNWGGTAPVSGDSLVFGGSTRLTNVNDWAADALTISNITFNSGSGPFRLTGSRITLDGTVVNNDDSTQKITLPLVLNATRTFNAAGTGTLAVDGVISGAGGVTKTGTNTLVLQANNSFEGVTTISSGILKITNSYGLGSAASGTVVADNARLELDGSFTVTNESITTAGNGGGGSNIGGLQCVNGFNTWAGNVTIQGSNARIGCAGGIGAAQLTISGVIDDGPSTVALLVRNADGGGPTVLSGANTYGGDTQIIVGYLRLAGGDNRLPTNTLLRIGNSSNVAFAQFNLNGCNQQVGGLKSEGSGMGTAITNSSGTAATLTVNVAASTTNLYGGTLAGNLSLVKGGGGNLTLTNNAGGLFNDIRIVAGTLTAGSPNALRGGTLDADYGTTGSVLFWTNLVSTLGGLKGSNNLDLVNSLGAGMTLAVGYNNQSTLYSGVLSGGALTKIGSGALTLAGMNTYTGRTVVSGGKLVVRSESQLGIEPGTLVTNQLTFDGGTLSVTNSFRLGPSNRGVALGAGGATFEVNNENSTLAVSNALTGAGGFTKNGTGLATLTTANTFDGGATVNAGVVRLFNSGALGSTVSGTTVTTGSQLELANGLIVSGERIRINGLGLQGQPKPPTSPEDSRGALQSAVGATAEWAGTVVLGSTDARVGAQNGGHLTVSGVVTDEGLNYTFRTSSDPNLRTRGVLLTATNAYGGRTEVTRGTTFVGTTNALPPVSVLNIHWSSANYGEYAALDLNGFDQTVGGLMNTGLSGGNAVVTNSSLTASTLTVNQASATDFNGVLAGNLALVKSGAGTLTLTSRSAHAGGTTVSGGTLRFGVAAALPGSSAVTLAGGTLDLANTTNTLASLTVEGSSTLALGSGKLTVSAQSAAPWSGLLTLTGTLGPTTLRVLPALTGAQLSQIRFDGRHVTQNPSGYVVPFFGTLIRVN